VQPSYEFHGIPNNKAGRDFVRNLSRYRNRGVIARVRTRAQKVKPGTKRGPWGDVKLSEARTLRVYLDNTHHLGRFHLAALDFERERAALLRQIEGLQQSAHRATQMQLDALKQATKAQADLNDIPRWLLSLIAWWRHD
jgi:hypothetical protein